MATLSHTRAFKRLRQDKREMRLMYGGARPNLLGVDDDEREPPMWMEAVRPIEERLRIVADNSTWKGCGFEDVAACCSVPFSYSYNAVLYASCDGLLHQLTHTHARTVRCSVSL